MTKEQFYGWAREDAAPLNEVEKPRKESWLTKRMKELKQQAEVNDERSESDEKAMACV